MGAPAVMAVPVALVEKAVQEEHTAGATNRMMQVVEGRAATAVMAVMAVMAVVVAAVLRFVF